MWASPADGSALRVEDDQLVSLATGEAYPLACPGVWDLVQADRSEELATWASGYSKIRIAEGRGAVDRDHYRRLPVVDSAHPFADHWKVRELSFERVVGLLDGPPLQIVDIGAGNGWAAARLADRGHHAVALDVVTDDVDGLGAVARHRPNERLFAARAEFDRLPLATGSADVVLAIASLHYAPDQAAAVAEAARVLRPGGTLLIVDSPFHRHRPSGFRMVAEQEQRLARLGTEVPATPGRGFVWRSSPQREWNDLGFSWRVQRSSPTARAMVARLAAHVRVRREAAALLTVIGTRNDTRAPSAPKAQMS